MPYIDDKGNIRNSISSDILITAKKYWGNNKRGFYRHLVERGIIKQKNNNDKISLNESLSINPFSSPYFTL